MSRKPTSAATAAPTTIRKVRCAVYTRKSTDEGLEKEFNSLDAQRESCEAYIASQRPEGWLLVPDYYDDGGVSGATLERPALQRLLRDIEADRVDVIVCYKIDRLSRSLMHFAKLVETFDAHNVTFVSVTQSFNTTTSMGRLTLNILLSFAQFEREVIGERVRDKIAALALEPVHIVADHVDEEPRVGLAAGENQPSFRDDRCGAFPGHRRSMAGALRP